tara:strand:- start:477 stop:665 length:189 start_codon:yes stop_codon:yes gene_type:complete
MVFEHIAGSADNVNALTFFEIPERVPNIVRRRFIFAQSKRLGSKNLRPQVIQSFFQSAKSLG